MDVIKRSLHMDIMAVDKKEAGWKRNRHSMEENADTSFPELLTRAVFCWRGEGKESGRAEGLRLLQGYLFYIK